MSCVGQALDPNQSNLVSFRGTWTWSGHQETWLIGRVPALWETRFWPQRSSSETPSPMPLMLPHPQSLHLTSHLVLWTPSVLAVGSVFLKLARIGVCCLQWRILSNSGVRCLPIPIKLVFVQFWVRYVPIILYTPGIKKENYYEVRPCYLKFGLHHLGAG